MIDYNNNTAEVTIELSGDEVRVIDIDELKAEAGKGKTKPKGTDSADKPKSDDDGASEDDASGN